MDTDLLKTLHDKLLELEEAGKSAEAQELIAQEFPKLSEEMQGDLLNRIYFSGLAREHADKETIAALQEKGLEVLDKADGEAEKAAGA